MSTKKNRIVEFEASEIQLNTKVEQWTSIDDRTKERLDKLSDEGLSEKFVSKHPKLFERPIIKDKLVLPIWPYERNLDSWIKRWFCCRHGSWWWRWWRCCLWPWPRPILRIRKNQRNLSIDEWERFLGAVNATMASGVSIPTYQEFVDSHVEAMTTSHGRGWGAHTMSPFSGLPASDGRNFLAWHREYLFKLEDRLRAHNPLVTIPYWDWVNDRDIPVEISNGDDLTRWGVTRNPTMSSLPTATQYANVLANTGWSNFTQDLESIHNSVHVAVGGTMNTTGSPSDPIFFLHHAMVDKIWADWQSLNSAQQSNLSEVLDPTSLFTRTVGQVQSIASLGYMYQ